MTLGDNDAMSGYTSAVESVEDVDCSTANCLPKHRLKFLTVETVGVACAAGVEGFGKRSDADAMKMV